MLLKNNFPQIILIKKRKKEKENEIKIKGKKKERKNKINSEVSCIKVWHKYAFKDYVRPETESHLVVWFM